MDSQDLKKNILHKISKIEDETLLKYIQEFLDASDKYYNKKAEDLDLEDDNKDTIDFTDYIKEWIKDM